LVLLVVSRAGGGAGRGGGGGGAARRAGPRAATASDYRWFEADSDLSKGFCFSWVRRLTPQQVLGRLGGKELERVDWQQLVGAGDGQRAGADRFFFGTARIGDWSLIVEDNGSLGVTDRLIRPLSKGTTLVSYHRTADGHGRFLVLEDQDVRLDFDPLDPAERSGRGADSLAPVIDDAGFRYTTGMRLSDDPVYYRTYCMEAAFALAERLTGVALTLDLLRTRTYLLSAVPRD
jgi:hypothetical protein